MATPKGFAKFIIVITCITAAIMELIDTSIVNVALSDMSGSLGVNIEDTSWIITSYAIANVIIIPLTGFLGEYFGRKKYYIGSMILFTLASYLCAQSDSLIEIVIWRFIQGIGGGALLSTSQAILFDSFEPKDRPIAAGMFGMGIVLGPTLGPTLGGFIIDHASWPLIFIINIPIGILATFLSISFIEEKPGEGTRKKKCISIIPASYYLPLVSVVCNMCWKEGKQKIGLAVKPFKSPPCSQPLAYWALSGTNLPSLNPPLIYGYSEIPISHLPPSLLL